MSLCVELKLRQPSLRQNANYREKGLGMSNFVLKVLVAIFACLVAILGVSDLKSVSDVDPVAPQPWWRRLTRWGKVKIACALVTLLLLGGSEYMSYSSTVATASQATEQENRLNIQLERSKEKLDEAKNTLAATFLELSRLSRSNEYLIRTIDQSVVRAGVSRIQPEQFDTEDIPMVFEGGGPVLPKNGDILEWSFVCRSGALPPVATCAGTGYGRFMANSYSIPITEKAGRETFFGTRSTGGKLEYRTPAEGGACSKLVTDMKTAQCELRLSVWREAKWQFKDLQDREGSKSLSASGAAQNACRRYEALYGESCDEAVRRLSQ